VLDSRAQTCDGRRVPDNTLRQRNRRRLLTLLAAVAGFYVWLIWFERRNVFQPTSALDASGEEIGFPKEDVWLTASDGVRLHAWYYSGRAGTNGIAFLLCHGNGGNISHRLDQYDALLRLDVAVLAFDYRGYGRSDGSPGEAGVYRDAEAAHDWLQARGFSAEKIVAHGESLGGGVAAELALRRPVGGLVLQSTFTSVPDLGSEIFPWLPVRTLGRIKLATRDKLPRVRVPVLVLHSRADTIIPFHHGERNFAAANEPKLFHELNGDHNDGLVVDRDAFSRGLGEFIQLIGRQPDQPGGSQ
jgi:fermentation-respiration switch protein FrsA (DUF1100 family)